MGKAAAQRDGADWRRLTVKTGGSRAGGEVSTSAISVTDCGGAPVRTCVTSASVISGVRVVRVDARDAITTRGGGAERADDMSVTGSCALAGPWRASSGPRT
jgi:hypothetical protein